MDASSKLAYVGAVTGVVGALTGIAGAVMGYVSFRRSQRMKALDLRLELRRVVSDAYFEIDMLPKTMEQAKQSRVNVGSVNGRGAGSGAFQHWMQEWEADFESHRRIADELPRPDETYADASTQKLEAALVDMHTLHRRAATLRSKYAASLAADEHERDHIRDDMRAGGYRR